MPIHDAHAVAEDIILTAARAAAAGALGAPQVTGMAGIRASIVYGDDLQGFVDGLLPLCGPDGRLNTYMFGDYILVKNAMDQGTPMAIVLVGGNALTSEMGWDCGACGFNTCAEFNKYSKEHIGPGAVGMGPSCNWKALDIGLAQAFATSAVHQMGVTGRIHYSFGALGMRCGYIEGVSICVGVSVGPMTKPLWDAWYNRPALAHTFTYDELIKACRQVFPSTFGGFCGRGDPPYRFGPEWQAKPMYWRVQEDPEYEKLRVAAVKEMLGVTAKYKEKLKKK